MMKHDEMAALLPRYCDGELDAPTAGRVLGHLAGCAACQAELAALRALTAQLAALPAAQPRLDDAAFWRRMQGQLPAQHAPLPPLRALVPAVLLLLVQVVIALVSLARWVGAALPGGSLLGDAFMWLAAPQWLPGGDLLWFVQQGEPVLGRLLVDLWSVVAGFGDMRFAALSFGLLYVAWLAVWWSRQSRPAQSAYQLVRS